MNDGSGNGTSCFGIEVRADASMYFGKLLGESDEEEFSLGVV